MTVYLNNETASPGLEFDDEDEVVIDRDETFIAHCQAYLAARAETWGRRYGNSISTRSKRWGLVWRVEVSQPLHPVGPDLTRRLVFWGSTAGGVEGVIYGPGGEAPLVTPPET